MVRIAASRPDAGSPYLKVAVTVENTTAWIRRGVHRDDAMPLSLISVHTMLAVDDGRFVSLLDPPDDAARAARACHSDGAYPVLIGDDDVVLSSPIILYDHPEVAPQSPGDLYDSLEIDEILALRVMTLTDEEKAEARGTDSRAAAIIDRCDDMSAETLGALHGQMKAVGSHGPSHGLEGARRTRTVHELRDHGRTRRPLVGPRGRRVVRPLDRVGVDRRRGGHQGQPPCGCGRRTGPTPTTSSCPAWRPPWPACSPTSTGTSTSPSPSTTIRPPRSSTWQGRYLFFHPDEVEPLVDQGQDR